MCQCLGIGQTESDVVLHQKLPIESGLILSVEKCKRARTNHLLCEHTMTKCNTR